MSTKERHESEREFKVTVQWNENKSTQQITVLTLALNPSSAIQKTLPRLANLIRESVFSIDVRAIGEHQVVFENCHLESSS